MDADIEYVSEAEDLLAALGEDLASLSEQQAAGAVRPDLINELFRRMHSFKGLSASVGLTLAARLSHQLENVIEGVRMGRQELSGPLIESLFDAVELLRGLIHRQGVESTSPAGVQSFLDRLEKLSDAPSLPCPAAAGKTDIAPAILRALTAYESQRLEQCLRQGQVVLLLDCSLPLDDLACALTGLQEMLKEHGEVIGTVPGEPVCNGCLDFCLLLAGCPPEKVGELVPAEYRLRLRLVSGTAGRPQESAAPSASRQVRGAQVVRIDVAQFEELLEIAKGLLLCKGRLSNLSDLVQQAAGGGVAGAVDTAVHELERGLCRLQRCLTDAGMVPVRHLFQRMARVVRSACRDREKQVRLMTRGGQVALGRAVLEQLHEPMLHLLRNAVDHGIESAAERLEAGKGAEGTVELEAWQRGGQIMIAVRDDGRGIDPELIRNKAMRMGLCSAQENLDARELYDLLFQPGFSTRAQVSEISGRGVGMDVVRSRMQALSGLVEIDSRPGVGTAVTLTLPVRKSIMQVLAVELAGRSYAVPLESILEVRPLSGDDLASADGNDVVVIREREVPLLDLRRLFGLPAAKPGPASHLVAVALGARVAGLVVDGLRGRRQAVIRPFDGFLRRIPGLAAVAELDDSRLALMLDVGGLLREVGRSETRGVEVLPNRGEDRRSWDWTGAASVAAPDEGQEEASDPATLKPDEIPAISPPPLAASRRLLTFFLAGREYGLDIREIIEIIDTVEFNPLPCAPAAVRGVVVWRDQVVPVLDACLRMGVGETSPGRFGKMILCCGGDQKLGILVERLGRLIGEPFEEVPVTEPSSGHEGGRCTAGAILAHGREVILLRTERLVDFPSCSVKEG